LCGGGDGGGGSYNLDEDDDDDYSNNNNEVRGEKAKYMHLQEYTCRGDYRQGLDW
jgi:hypothetical protein